MTFAAGSAGGLYSILQTEAQQPYKKCVDEVNQDYGLMLSNGCGFSRRVAVTRDTDPAKTPIVQPYQTIYAWRRTA